MQEEIMVFGTTDDRILQRTVQKGMHAIDQRSVSMRGVEQLGCSRL
jgi:hypothetical protein